MSTEANQTLVQRVVEEFWQQGNLAVASEVFAADYVHHNPTLPNVRDREGLIHHMQAIHAAFADFSLTTEDLIVTVNQVVLRYTCRGTQTGAFLGHPPTGQEITTTGISIYRIAAGKIVETWTLSDGIYVA